MCELYVCNGDVTDGARLYRMETRELLHEEGVEDPWDKVGGGGGAAARELLLHMPTRFMWPGRCIRFGLVH